MRRLRAAAIVFAWACVPAYAAPCSGAYLDKATIETCLARPAMRGLPSARNLVAHWKAAPAEPASINLFVNFAFDSSALTTDTRIALDQLAQALSGPRLSGKTFLVAGHTDAVGTAAYNQVLSENRSAAVRDYLVNAGHISADRLKVAGYGFTRPMNSTDLMAPENRRVEVTAQ
jgi:outer membrane protein OmpA-like peptidoglycan-associated protein